MAKRIITISRDFGSGGRFIGEKVAKKLGITYYDKNIISEIAEKSGLSPEYIQESAELSDQKWGKASNYTLCLNSSQLGYDRCEAIIMECVK